ncbi:MAG: TetR/AcrR family transcriptional regulator, partial [Actinomycetota bacterium]
MNNGVLQQSEHPTKVTLVECTRNLVSRLGVDAVTVEMVLTDSGVSKGSLYHHFKDFDALIETVQVRSFSEFVDEGISFLEAALGSATSRDELRANLHAVIPLAHDPARAPHRIDRARIV